MLSETIHEQPVTLADEAEHDAVKKLAQLLADDTLNAQGAQLLMPDGQRLDLPESIYAALRRIIPILSQGDAIALVPLHKDLTTSQAAELLNVSRPFLIKLLDESAMPYTTVGTHRRIRLQDVMAYKARRDVERGETLAQLTRMSQDLGLYE